MRDTDSGAGALVRQMHDAFLARDLARLASFWADDIRYVAPGLELHGKEARILEERKWLNALTDNFIEVEAMLAEGDQAVEFCVMGGMHTGNLVLPDGNILPPTQRQISGYFTSRYRFLGDKLIEQRLIYDRLSLAEQLHGPHPGAGAGQAAS